MKLFEVFEDLQVNEELTSTFNETELLKVTVLRKSSTVVLSIDSTKLIPRRSIQKMQRELKQQCFANTKGNLVFCEHYQLSSQYNLENLWYAYKESLFEELSEESVMLGAFVKKTAVSFTEKEIHVTVEDTFLNRHTGEELREYVEPLFLKRFDMEIFVRIHYEKEEKRNESYSQSYEFLNRDVLQAFGVKRALEASEQKGKQSVATTVKKGTVSAGNKQVEKNKKSEGSTSVSTKVSEANHTHVSQAGTGKQLEGSLELKSEPKGEVRTEAKKFDGKRDFVPKKKIPDDPDLFYGRPFEGEVTPLSDIQDEIGECVIHGKVIKYEDRPLKNNPEKFFISAYITDFTDTIGVKLFVKSEDIEELKGHLKEGKYVKLKGLAALDRYDHEVCMSAIVGIKNIPSFEKKRMDTSEKKRIELHAHTVMSDMDSVVDTKKLVKTAFEWGHSAVAITDHGVVQSFPEANHALNPKDYKDDPEKMQRAKDFKVIYGVEAYLVDDVLEAVANEKGQSLSDAFVVFDIETTGFGAETDRIIEIGAVKVVNGEITDKYSTFINPQIPIPLKIENLTGIKDDMVMDAPRIETVLPEFLEFCKDCVLVAHNASFDVGFIKAKAEQLNREHSMNLQTDFTVVDTVSLARTLLPDLKKFKLNVVAKALEISLENHHRAVDDAGATAQIYVRFLKMLQEQGASKLSEVNTICKPTPDMIKKMPTYHAIMLCQNEIGRINLYRLVSLSHIDYYAKRPRIPKSLFLENREGLLIGSACEAGELYQALLRESPMEEVTRLCEFYDYYEIQPLGNNRFMIESDKHENIKSEEDLIELNKKIIELGEQFDKPVVGTCDVHFMNPEDEVYRRIIMSSKGFADADNQAPLYFRTTEEMLREFDYLSPEKAEEIVITNPAKISDRIEKISPVFPDKCAPVIEDSDKELRTICYDKAHSMYGNPLPELVEKRLEHELNSIITNGFAVMYIIAQKLVWKSNEDGYLVGSRGSVGSSFAATMSGITEVNPLPAHYYCPNCFFTDFDSDEVKAAQKKGMSGCDMPDRLCPNCGKPLQKDGHDIPFETFLGFNGDKEPDIDLNFSGEYQSKAHDYTEVIFGKGQTFRAGTIGTLADKTAYGYVKKYEEEHGIVKRNAERERIAAGCVGVRRTTGQHPGGIIVLPIGHEIYKFTPVQRPANDMTTKTVTTHFDYHSIDHNLLKLDILGHDDPTMIRRLEDLTGVDATAIRMDDEKVISLFHCTDALGVKPEDLGGCDLGSLGLPELGTEFVMQMLRDTKPQSFSDMIRISGLSHGTNVWQDNTQVLIQQEKCTLSNAICTRDDIMTYLIHQGVESGHAFKIMESVRKGKGLTEEMEQEMVENNVPDWYIWSCKQIKYMFPKAHACAYVMMAFRIAHFKVYYPLAYYAAYFGIRAKAFNYELMCLGKETLERNMRDIKRKLDTKTAAPKDADVYGDMRIVQEMYARGFEFMPIDIYTAKAHAFQIVDGKLMPSLDTIDGLGEKAADGIVEAVKDGPFLSRDDFKNRCKVSQTTTDLMADLGLLGDIPLSNQMSILDFLTM